MTIRLVSFTELLFVTEPAERAETSRLVYLCNLRGFCGEDSHGDAHFQLVSVSVETIIPKPVFDGSRRFP